MGTIATANVGFDLDLFFQGVGKRDMWTQSSFVMPFMRGVDGIYANQMDYVTQAMVDNNTIDQSAMYPRLYGGNDGYGVLKFDEPATPAIRLQSTTTNETDAPIFWLADIYLDYAEACAELGTITKDDLDKSINLLRTRVGMPELTLSPAADPANNMEVSDLIWEIRRERRVELMYDKDDRYWCLIRWHQLDKLDTQKYPDQTKGAWINPEWKNPNDPSKPFYDETNVTLDAEGYIDCNTANIYRIYDKKHYLAPIPSGQSTLNPAIGQNLGWE